MRQTLTNYFLGLHKNMNFAFPLTAENFAARLTQANLVRKSNFDNKRINYLK